MGYYLSRNGYTLLLGLGSPESVQYHDCFWTMDEDEFIKMALEARRDIFALNKFNKINEPYYPIIQSRRDGPGYSDWQDAEEHYLNTGENLIPVSVTKQDLLRIRRANFQSLRPKLFLELIDRDGERCSLCASGLCLSIDHVVPLSKGGTDEIGNLRLLCKRCNSKKGDRAPSQGQSTQGDDAAPRPERP